MINNGASNCLATTVHADGTCACGSTQGVLECPGTASPTAAGTSDLYCSCNQDSDCGAGAACNTSSHLCFYALPSPTSFTGFAPSSPWNWELPAAGDTASFCLSHPGVTYNGNSIPAQVWWSGNVFARTGCQPDGTSCLTGDCTNHPNSSCSAGTGGNQPASLAEITMQSTATDYYDVSVINGANVGVEFGPIAGPTQAPGNVPPQYWCATPGSRCGYDFGKYTTNVPLPSASNPTDYTTTLTLAESACTVGTGNPRAGQPPTGCPAFVDPQGDAYSCSGAANARNGACYKTCSSDSQCPGNLRCLQAGDGNSYCQCSAQTDCGTGQYCGTQLVPGLGSSTLSPQLYLQQCGSFEGWWTADTLCGNVNTIVGAPPPGKPALNCRAGLTDGDGKTTNIASLLECATFSSSAPGGVAGNPANASSCYNSVAGASAGCCGCATDPSNPLSDLWPSASAGCVNNNSTWASQVQPLVAILKQACPTAYSYPYDDFTSTFQCQGQGASNLVGYAITFTDLPAPTSK